MYHPERYLVRQDKYEKIQTKKLKKILNGQKIDSEDMTLEILDKLMTKEFFDSLADIMRRNPKAELVEDLDQSVDNFISVSSEKELNEFYSYLDAPFKAVMDEIQTSIESEDPSKATSIVRTIHKMKKSMSKSDLDLRHELVNRSIARGYHIDNGKLYVVSKNLEHRLISTELRNIMAEDVRLPAESVYIMMPQNPPFVAHRVTFKENSEKVIEKHEIEGVYLLLTRENNDTRQVQCAVISRNRSLPIALSYIMLSNGKTVNDCLNYTLEITRNKYKEMGYEDIGVSTHEIVESCFQYLMKVCIYTTVPNSDISVLNSNPEFQKLWTRALKAKGEKRKKLFKQANENKGSSRILLGGSLVISREEKEIAKQIRRGEGISHRVRTYVQGHWQRYWKKDPENPNEKRREWVFKQAFWKGDDSLPISNKKHILK